MPKWTIETLWDATPPKLPAHFSSNQTLVPHSDFLGGGPAGERRARTKYRVSCEVATLRGGYGSKYNHQGTAGFSLWFHLPGFYFGYACLTHSQVSTLGCSILGLMNGYVAFGPIVQGECQPEWATQRPFDHQTGSQNSPRTKKVQRTFPGDRGALGRAPVVCTH